MRIVIILWLIIGHQEVWRIGKSSKEPSNLPSILSSIIKFKKWQTRNGNLGSLWAASTNASYQPLSPSSIKIVNVLRSMIFGMPSILHLTRHSIVKSMSTFSMKLMTNLFCLGPPFQKRSLDLLSPIVIIRLLLTLINCYGVIWNIFSRMMSV